MKKYISEFIGTFALTFFACGVAVTIGCNTPSGIIATSLSFGLVIITMASTISSTSGCHINPAVTIAMYLDKRIDKKDTISYIIAQILGALAGSLILAICLGSFKALGANAYGNMLPNDNEVTPLMAFIIETILTFFFITVILTVTKKKEYQNIWNSNRTNTCLCSYNGNTTNRNISKSSKKLSSCYITRNRIFKTSMGIHISPNTRKYPSNNIL